MFIRKKTKLNKRGFSLAESVLALAVISISSVGILSLVISTQRATINAAQKQQAQLYAMDIINCYRVSSTTADFNTNVKFALGADIIDNTITLNNMTATISIDENNTLKVIVENDKKLTEIEFTKGVALDETPEE